MIPYGIPDRTGKYVNDALPINSIKVLLSVKIVFKPQTQRSCGSKFENQFVMRNVVENFFFFLIRQNPDVFC